MDRRIFVCSLPKIDSVQCTRTWIPVYSRSQVSVYRTIDTLVIYAYEDDYYGSFMYSMLFYSVFILVYACTMFSFIEWR